jgi:hypothetical protein
VLDTVETTDVLVDDEQETFRELSRYHDRCDRCGAQAFILAINEAGQEMTFCGHHGRRYEASLMSQGFIIDDQSHTINPSPSPSSSEID